MLVFRGVHDVALDRVVNQNYRKEIGALKRRLSDQNGQLQSCAEQMVALQGQLKQEQSERSAKYPHMITFNQNCEESC